jgi:hypothetical protein
MKFPSPAGLLPLISGMTGGRLRGFLRAPAAFFEICMVQIPARTRSV